MAVFFIADTHFGDDAIRRYEGRPFSSRQEMDEELIRRWNGAVTDEEAVAQAIEDGKLGGLGADVYSVEPFGEAREGRRREIR